MDPVEWVICFVLVVIILVSVMSNVLVLICFLYDSEIRKQVPGLFTVNLTGCHLLLSVSSMPLTLVGLIRQQQPAGESVCRAVGFLETCLSSSCMLTAAGFGVDRWLTVGFPLSYRSRRRRDAVIGLGYAWVHSVGFSAAAARLSWLDFHPLYASCTLSERARERGSRFVVFTAVFHALTFLAALVVLSVTHMKVLKVARCHCRRIDVITMQTLLLLVDMQPSVRQRFLEEQRKRRQRAVRKISIFIGSFLICFAPYVITRLLELSPAVPLHQYWTLVSKCLAYSKAACDPFVYSLLRLQYRKTCSDILNRLLKRRSLSSSEWNQRPRTILHSVV